VGKRNRIIVCGSVAGKTGEREREREAGHILPPAWTSQDKCPITSPTSSYTWAISQQLWFGHCKIDVSFHMLASTMMQNANHGFDPNTQQKSHYGRQRKTEVLNTLYF
jgi:hypothetical protein